MQLHIFNGQSMLAYFLKRKVDDGLIYTSFNEAMCTGEADVSIFSNTFNQLRSHSLDTSVEEYTKTVINPLTPLLEGFEGQITLWFDPDMFCQINLLTLLAYMDQSGYAQSVRFHLVDYNNTIIESHTLTPQGYKEIYDAVLISKFMPEEIPLPVMDTGIKRYLHLQEKDNEVVEYIKSYPSLSANDLVCKLLENFQHYGLGDTQYLQLIEKTR